MGRPARLREDMAVRVRWQEERVWVDWVVVLETVRTGHDARRDYCVFPGVVNVARVLLPAVRSQAYHFSPMGKTAGRKTDLQVEEMLRSMVQGTSANVEDLYTNEEGLILYRNEEGTEGVFVYDRDDDWNRSITRYFRVRGRVIAR